MQSQIRSLILLLCSAVLLSAALVFSMAYFLGPTGAYIAKDVLLEPQLVPSLSYHDSITASGNADVFIFDKIEYVYRPTGTHQTTTVNVPVDAYAEFFHAVQGDTSFVRPPQTVVSVFQVSPPSRLVLKVKPASASSASAPSRDFLEVHFAQEGDYYRVELRDADVKGQWAYFEHTGIRDLARRYFIPKQP